MRGKNEGRYPFHYLEMIDNIFGYEPNTIEVCSRSVLAATREAIVLPLILIPIASPTL